MVWVLVGFCVLCLLLSAGCLMACGATVPAVQQLLAREQATMRARQTQLEGLMAGQTARYLTDMTRVTASVQKLENVIDQLRDALDVLQRRKDQPAHHKGVH